MREAAIVAASYLLVYAVELFFYDAPVFQYYFLLLATTTVVIYLCSLSPSKPLIIYAYMQFAVGFLYLLVLTDYYELAYQLLYGAPINFSLIVMGYELAIIMNGVAANGIGAFTAWMRHDNRVSRFNH